MTIISSGIYPIDPTITDGTQLAGYINELVEAINSNQASSTRPPMITKGGLWTKTLTGDDVAVMVYDGTNDVEIAKMQGGDLIINNENVYTKDEIDAILEDFEPSGGGSTPTPEALVWEDKTADRVAETVYTNTNDVPLYVQLYVTTETSNNS